MSCLVRKLRCATGHGAPVWTGSAPSSSYCSLASGNVVEIFAVSESFLLSSHEEIKSL
jgi:hypothetical protein